MRVTGRVVGEPTEEPWTDREDKERIQRSLAVVDDSLKAVVNFSFRENDDHWADIVRLRDGEHVALDVTRMLADRYGRIKLYGRLVQNGS